MATKGYKGYYVKALWDYGFLSVIMGFFFGWLLTFPMLGPSLMALAASRGVDSTNIGVIFIAFHAFGVVIYGIWGPHCRTQFIYRMNYIHVTGKVADAVDNIIIDNIM